ncbi:unnamed protein product [Ixodes persulcatus]
MAAARKRAGCQELQIWVLATTNHLYYSAKAGAGNRKLTVDVWLSLKNNAINKHTGHGVSYPRCLHNEVPESSRKLMDPSNSQAYDHLKKIPGDMRPLKDVGQMSPHGQTYVLEAFHSVLINFALKSQAFPPAGMLESCECTAKEGLCNHALALLQLVALLKGQGYEEAPPRG